MTYHVDVTTTARRPLTRERVIETAVSYADAHGLEEMSMRKLGTELGVEAMALYNHVDNKDDLYDGMIDYVFSEITLADTSLPWREQLRLIGADTLEKFTEHPWVVLLLCTRGTFGNESLRFTDHIIGILFDAGFSEEDTHHAWQMLASHTMGYAFQAAFGTDPEDKDFSTLEERLPKLARVVPNVVRISQQLIDCSWDTEYLFGLEIILDGLEARIETTQ
jgi:AcrR family transcriptional regulator